MTRIALCDDEQIFLSYARKTIRNAVQKWEPEIQIDCFTDSSLLMKQVRAGIPYRIFFLDIDMPEISGITAGKWIRKYSRDAFIIYLSGKEERVFETFACRPYSFIRKEYFSREISGVIKSIYEDLNREGDCVSVLAGGIWYKWDVNKIVYVECTNRILHIHFIDHVLDIYYKLGTLEEQLSPYGFIRIHKGYLVNGRFIFCVKGNLVVMDNGEELPLSKYRTAEVRKAFMDFVE